MGIAPPAVHYCAENEGEARKRSIASRSFRGGNRPSIGKGALFTESYAYFCTGCHTQIIAVFEPTLARKRYYTWRCKES